MLTHASMSTKRKNRDGERTDTPQSHGRKKVKIQEARQIAIQVPTHVADGNSKFPVSLDVENFADARRFEITAMQDSMVNARAGSSKRSWQKLPRHLRRRAASHDTRRVPMYLRDKARAEMDPHNKNTSPRSKSKKAGKTGAHPRTDALLKRQRDKLWLETHIWHAKRMKMETLWGYRLALHPTEKAFRSSHRASRHGCILHDASYHEIIEVRAPQAVLIPLLDLCCESSASPGSVRYLTGSRACEALLYMPNSYPYDLIGPITILWRPAVSLGSDNLPSSRIVWVVCHPSIFESAFRSLAISSSFAVEALKPDDKRRHRVEVVDLRGKFNIFELMGPKSSQVIKGALTPVLDHESEEFDRFWNGLQRLQCPGGLPSGMVVGLEVHDPRLSFPPVNPPVHASKALTSQQSVPSPHLAYSKIWDSISVSAGTPRFRKKDLDERRAKNSIPGGKLDPLREDDQISLLLIRRTISDHCDSQPVHGWTMIIPSGWAMPFLTSLTHTGTLVGGQQQRDVQMLEAGVPQFPRDFPTTEPYRERAEAWDASERYRWERTPPAKRVNYERLGIDNPWKADWENVLDQYTPGVAGYVPTQRDTIHPWLLSKYLASFVLETTDISNPAVWLYDKLSASRSGRGNTGLRLKESANDLWCGALVQVQVELHGRGTLSDVAAVYPLRDDEVQICGSFFESLRESLELQLSPQDVIMGYLTSGVYSLSRGRPHGIGTVALSRLVEVRKQMLAISSPVYVVKVRNVNSDSCRLAQIKLFDHLN
ncbi:POP1-domain-containing protein [Thelephora ganbajun]|uniref:POP1-domain-containing protein n=1 Tax=Thelephora ganbajun TaxID=370292 RepID=A0ACB6ZPG2_THEGA|nr:POP1-domain-containing protein [Thelephora ganbajun]